MLIYLATYPRSGHAILKDTLYANWRLITANGYDDAGVYGAANDVRESNDPDLFSYRGAESERRHLLRSPALPRLTSALRERLAADTEPFFVKTHELPPEGFFPGEGAIQIVRHPAAAIVSQWRLHRATNDASPPLAHFSEGSDTSGRWDRYHDAWMNSAIPLSRVRYEDVLDEPLSLVETIASFCGLISPDVPRFVSMEEAKSRNPIRNPGEGVDGWKDQITVGELIRIWNRHKGVAKTFGYYPFGISGPMPYISSKITHAAASSVVGVREACEV